MSRISDTMDFLVSTLEGCTHFEGRPGDLRYRLEHSMRVAHIGREIALAEGFDETAMVIACLLHDIGYARDVPGGWTRQDVIDHARYSAQIARPFIEKLGFPADVTQDMLYGIAIHSDGEADFPGVETPFAATISDADNIDRFDAYRIYDNLQYDQYSEMEQQEQREYCEMRLARHGHYAALIRSRLSGASISSDELPCGTDTGARLWLGRLELSLSFYGRLLAQLDASRPPEEEAQSAS